MKKFIFTLIFLCTPLILFPQEHSGTMRLTAKQEFRPFLTGGVGMIFAKRYQSWNNSLNVTAEMDFHLGKGYYIGTGFNTHDIPSYPSNHATYLFVLARKGFYMFDRFAVYGGLGGTIGVTNKGHPGCCLGGAYASLYTAYDFHKYFAAGIDLKMFTDFSEISFIPGLQSAFRFWPIFD